MATNPFDWSSIVENQFQQALRETADENLRARTDYADKCKNWIEVNSHSREINLHNPEANIEITPPPTIPRKKIVTKQGLQIITTYEAFGDLQPPVLPPVQEARSGSLVSPNAPPDKLELILFALGIVKNDLDAQANALAALRAVVDAIRAKVGA